MHCLAHEAYSQSYNSAVAVLPHMPSTASFVVACTHTLFDGAACCYLPNAGLLNAFHQWQDLRELKVRGLF